MAEALGLIGAGIGGAGSALGSGAGLIGSALTSPIGQGIAANAATQLVSNNSIDPKEAALSQLIPGANPSADNTSISKSPFSIALDQIMSDKKKSDKDAVDKINSTYKPIDFKSLYLKGIV